MDIKALFFDIDGTLVSFKTHVIPQSTVDALQWAREQGIMIFISTGRPVPFIVNLKQIEHLIDGYITTNGAYCFIGQKTVSCHSIGRSDIDRVLTACGQWDAPCIVVGTNHIGVYHSKPIVDQSFREGLGLIDFEFTDLPTVMREPILQLTPFITPEQEAALMPTLSACTSGRWTPAFTDITHSNADKGKGLLAMAAFLDIDIEGTMAFGDGGNDISILRQAGVGVAMGNAGEEVKRHADFVTNSVDEDGIRNALEKMIG
ncbi:MAG: Cof-type HAD-IIB family hydrolase [Prevotella sp.]|nr:Cof-type HAD-IIB family hydrolase [Prevotella sp.]